nr:MAG TPA: Methyltransferase domain [Caudoviricetes sp.]
MITYDDKQAKVYTDFIVEKQKFGLLQGWVQKEDPVEHCEYLLKMFWDKEDDPLRVLDIGCGTGEMLYQASEIWPRAETIGVNLFPSQLPSKDLDTFSSELVVGNFETDALKLEGTAPGFDLIMFNYTLGHFDNLSAVFSTAANMLTPYGRIGVYDIKRRSVLCKEVLGYHLWSKCEIVYALDDAGLIGDELHCERMLSKGMLPNHFSSDEDIKACNDFADWTDPILLVAKEA